MTDATTQAVGIEIVRTFDASPDAVWAAWTTPEQFAAWYGGEGPTVVATIDLRPGGRWTADMVTSDGREIPFHGEYLEVDAPHRLVMTLTDDPSSEERATVTVTFTRAGDGTEMRFTQSGGNLPPEAYQRAREGWGKFFDKLAADLAA